jgi:tetratricopeptide (TPR) repeat protein
MDTLAGDPAELGRSLRRERALDHFRQSTAMSAAIGDDHGQARALDGLSEVLRDIGELDQAMAYARQSAALTRRTGDREGEVYALLLMADALARGNDIEQARHHWHEAVTIIDEVHNPQAERLRDEIAARLRPVELGAG